MFTDITVMQVVFLDYFFTFISSEVYPIDFWMFFKIIRISLRLMWSEQQNISGTQIFPFFVQVIMSIEVPLFRIYS